jgi:methyl-accepting chemotaxis protein
MKGTIHFCLEKTVKDVHGENKWKECLAEAGYAKDYTFARHILDDLDETDTLSIFKITADKLGLTIKELFDQFGKYWCCDYGPEMYPQFYAENKSTKEFIESLDRIHTQVTSKKPGATPPRFKYDWKNDGRLLVHYQSDRDLFELFESILRGLDTYFKTSTGVERAAKNQLLLRFDSAGTGAASA